MAWAVVAMVRDRVFKTATQKAVMQELAHTGEEDGSEMRAGVTTIADVCQVDRRTVQRTLRELEKLGLITMIREAVHEKQLPRLYHINVHVLETWPLTEAAKRARERIAYRAEQARKAAKKGRDPGGTMPPPPGGATPPPPGGATPP
ncbi:MAG TPA: helix-turn-helix domain-containing protein, partial [Kiloniellaceae bacterium]|nr:helix-turn-helix domain-containing protein [Kiloniellaceae bacterium]